MEVQIIEIHFLLRALTRKQILRNSLMIDKSWCNGLKSVWKNKKALRTVPELADKNEWRPQLLNRPSSMTLHEKVAACEDEKDFCVIR